MPHTLENSSFTVLGPSEEYGELRPSAFELPVLRVRFLDPCGNPQHLTYSTTWCAMNEMTLSLVNGRPDTAFDRQFRGVLSNAMGALVTPLGCQLIGVDVVAVELQGDES